MIYDLFLDCRYFIPVFCTHDSCIISCVRFAGGAADVAMMAMVKINQSELLQRLGWILLMQIHDEVILEGPEETAEEAFVEVLRCMEAPWTIGLKPTLVPLSVDGSWNHKNWYDAK